MSWCPDCGADVEVLAIECPSCDFPIPIDRFLEVGEGILCPQCGVYTIEEGGGLDD